MARWMKPTEDTPICSVGERIVIIVSERERAKASLRPRLVTLVAEEEGWAALEDTYSGYGCEDAVLWAYERDVCAVALAVCPEAF